MPRKPAPPPADAFDDDLPPRPPPVELPEPVRMSRRLWAALGRLEKADPWPGDRWTPPAAFPSSWSRGPIRAAVVWETRPSR